MVFGQFNDSFPPTIDGVSNVAINYARILNKLYGECYMITLKNPDTMADFPFEVLSYKSFALPYRSEYRWGMSRLDHGFRKKLFQIPFDVVHAHSPFSTGAVAKKVAKIRGVPLVATLHSKYREDFKGIIKSDRLVNDLVIKRIVRFYENADDVWTVNESTIETLREYGYRGDVFVMNNGSDITITGRNINSKLAIMEKFGFNRTAPLFAFVGQHIAQKNLMLIIRALDILNAHGIDFGMLFIGEGPERSTYQAHVGMLGLGSKIRFTGRINDRELLRRIYASADAILFPSLYDTSSLVIKEAAACQCPTVFVEGSTTSQGVVDGINGFLAKNDPYDFAAKIRHIIETDGLSQRAGIGACDTLYVSWDDIVKKVHNRYLYVVDRHERNIRAAMSFRKNFS